MNGEEESTSQATKGQTKLSLLPCGIRGVQHKAVFKTLSDITIEQLQRISGPDREGWLFIRWTNLQISNNNKIMLI